MTIRPRIIIAEDHTFTLEGLRTLPAADSKGAAPQQAAIHHDACQSRISRVGISVKTVSFHRENIKRKLAAHSTAELTKRAMEFLLID